MLQRGDGRISSRIHVADAVVALTSSMKHPIPGLVINLADDLPCQRSVVLSYAFKLLGWPDVRSDADVDVSTDTGAGDESQGRQRQDSGSKMVSNSLMRDLLRSSGVEALRHPTYESGLLAIVGGDVYPFASGDDYLTQQSSRHQS